MCGVRSKDHDNGSSPITYSRTTKFNEGHAETLANYFKWSVCDDCDHLHHDPDFKQHPDREKWLCPECWDKLPLETR